MLNLLCLTRFPVDSFLLLFFHRFGMLIPLCADSVDILLAWRLVFTLKMTRKIIRRQNRVGMRVRAQRDAISVHAGIGHCNDILDESITHTYISRGNHQGSLEVKDSRTTTRKISVFSSLGGRG